MVPTRIEIDRILCPVDFSDFSRHALERAVRLGGWFRARVEVLHVVPFVLPTTGLPYFPVSVAPSSSLREQAARDLEAFVAPHFDAGVPIEAKLLEGDPWRAIRDEAEGWSADLLVMGTHGRGGFEHLILGSVTEKVMRRAPCPVMTVGRVAPLTPGGPLFRRIVCAADLSPASERTLETAVSLAGECDAQVTHLHVLESIPFAVGGGLESAIPDPAELRRVLVERVEGDLRKAVPPLVREFCEVKERVEVGSAWRQILCVADEVGADLIVMGEHAHGGVGRLVFGSTASHVVRQATCPVLVVRERRSPVGADAAVEAGVASVRGRR